MGIGVDQDGATAERPPERRAPTRRFEAKRSAILRSAVEALNRNGVRGMTLGEVAARLDLVPTGVIYYFRNKEDLAAAAFLKGLEGYEALISASARGEADTGRVGAFIHAYFDHARKVGLGEADPFPVFNDVRALNCAPVNLAYEAMFRSFRGLLTGQRALPRLHRNARAHLLLSEVFWIPAWLNQVEAAD